MQERKIVFRGKRVDTGEWVYGFYTLYGRSRGLHPAIITGTEEGCVIPVFIDPETVGEYTGLTDKNGVKIFEGDILNTTNSNYAIWYVDYKNTAFCCNQGNANYSCVLDEFMQYSDIEVIDNIHDNPELLEEKQ